MSDSLPSDGVVSFRPLSAGRWAVLLGKVQVGEIAPTEEQSRHTHCFRLSLPDSAAAPWRPARDLAVARFQVLRHLNDWLNAADLVPVSGRRG
jgi:hypothetical protein